MNAEKRTIARLIDDKASAELAVKELEKIHTVLCNPTNEHCSDLMASIQKATKTEINPAYSTQKALESLRDYIRAIQTIIDTTEVDWPKRQ